MTRLEFDTFTESKCPCGAGLVLRHVASTDYRHDKPKITYSLGCTNCMSRWRLEHGTLVERESELPYLAAKLSDESARKQLAYVALEVTRRYLSSLTFRSEKAELEYLTSHNLTGATYASYLKDRGNGRTMSDLAYTQRNPSWLIAAASSSEERNQLALLIGHCQQTSSAADAAAKQIIRRSLRTEA